MRRAVFLDRDGVLNQAIVRAGRPYPPFTLSEVVLLPGVPEALARLKSAGFWLIVVTNQPDVARGSQSRETVETINAWLGSRLPIDSFRVCYHDEGKQCDCRKPAPGMLIDAAHEFELTLSASFMVGDRWRDVEAGKRAGCRTVFIDYRYDEQQPAHPDWVTDSLPAAADWILSQK